MEIDQIGTTRKVSTYIASYIRQVTES